MFPLWRKGGEQRVGQETLPIAYVSHKFHIDGVILKVLHLHACVERNFFVPHNVSLREKGALSLPSTSASRSGTHHSCPAHAQSYLLASSGGMAPFVSQKFCQHTTRQTSVCGAGRRPGRRRGRPNGSGSATLRGGGESARRSAGVHP